MQRVNQCGRMALALQLGHINIELNRDGAPSRFCLEKNNRMLYSFPNIDMMERFLENTFDRKRVSRNTGAARRKINFSI